MPLCGMPAPLSVMLDTLCISPALSSGDADLALRLSRSDEMLRLEMLAALPASVSAQRRIARSSKGLTELWVLYKGSRDAGAI